MCLPNERGIESDPSDEYNNRAGQSECLTRVWQKLTFGTRMMTMIREFETVFVIRISQNQKLELIRT